MACGGSSFALRKTCRYGGRRRRRRRNVSMRLLMCLLASCRSCRVLMRAVGARASLPTAAPPGLPRRGGRELHFELVRVTGHVCRERCPLSSLPHNQHQLQIVPQLGQIWQPRTV